MQSLIADADTAMLMIQIDCCTLELGATASDIASYNLEAQAGPNGIKFHHGFSSDKSGVDFPLVVLLDFTEVDPMMSLARELNHVEWLLRLGRTYSDGVFENPGWRSMDQIFEFGPLEKIYHHMFDGQILLGVLDWETSLRLRRVT